MGEAPRWYSTIQAARYLRVEPWVLADRPLWWQEAALAAMAAEEHARRQHEKDARRTART